MIVRRLGPGDGPIFGRIRLQSLREAPTSFAAEASDYEDATDADWERALAARIAFVALDDATPVGLAALVPMKMSRMAHRATIINVFVAPAARGRGIAHALLDALEEHARSLGIVQLELAVNAENAPGLAFYAARGYARIGLVPRGFRHGAGFSDEVLMCRAIDRSADPA